MAAKKALPVASDPQQIFDAQDIREETVEIPEWGCSVVVRGYSLAVEDLIDEQSLTADGTVDESKRSVLMIVHGVTQPAFTPDDVVKLREKSSAALARVLGAIAKVNSTDPKAVEEATARFLSGGAD